jgi:outer membrane lipoprotein-sorting protein
LNLILGNNIDLGRAKMVIGHGGDATTTTVRAQDPQHPEYGTIDLIFSNQPVELRKWVITDEAGGKTTVSLGEMRKGESYPPSLFNITIAMEKRGL